MKLLVNVDEISSKPALAFVILCAALIVLDSIIVRIYGIIPKEPPTIVSLLLFEGLFVFLALSGYIFLRPLGSATSLTDSRLNRISKVLYRIVILNQITLCGLVGSIAISLAIFGSYYLQTISLIVYVSFVPAIGYLMFLGYHLFLWFKGTRNFPSLMYGFAFSLLIVNLIISAAYLSLAFSFYEPIIQLKPIKATISQVQSPSGVMVSLGAIYDYLYPVAFLLTWIATVIQLRNYSLSLGKVKYWILIAAPLVYYLFPLTADYMGIFDSIRLEHGSEFNLIYAIVFSPYKQVGGLLFGIVFWITALKVKRKDLGVILKMAGTGMILLFGSTVLHGLSYIIAPPFGIITISFTALAAYLVMVGLYSSAIILSADANLRKDVRNLFKNNANLLHGIGSAEFQRKLHHMVATIARKQQDEIAKQTGISSTINDDDIKEYLDEVSKEIRQDKP